MKGICKWFVILAGVICLTTSTAFALKLVAEQRFTSTSGTPVEDDLTFSGHGYKDFVLKVANGNDDGDHRVSSATVSLNGIKILGPADFNQKVATLERTIAPQDGDNTLTVSLRSNPDGFLQVQVLGELVVILPPDPGAAGEETIEGIDSNTNGVRDDIERWIWMNYGDSEKTRLALTQAYYPLQNFMVHARQGDRDAVYNDMTAMQRANECLNYILPEHAYMIGRELQALIVNTSDRVHAYGAASRILGGGSFPHAPRSRWKNSCTFNPDELVD